MASNYRSNFLTKKSPFWYNAKFSKDKCKLEMYLVLISQTSELDRNWFLFLIINNSKENIYSDCSSKIFSSLNNSQQESLLPETVITLIILFWILKIY